MTDQCSRYFGSSSFERAVLATLGFLNNLTFLSILPLQVLSSYSVHLVCPGIFSFIECGFGRSSPQFIGLPAEGGYGRYLNHLGAQSHRLSWLRSIPENFNHVRPALSTKVFWVGVFEIIQSILCNFSTLGDHSVGYSDKIWGL